MTRTTPNWPTKRNRALGLFVPPKPPTTVAEKLAAIATLAKAAAASEAKVAAAASEAESTRNSLQRDRHMHEIHCLAVELGLADRQPHRYEVRSVPLWPGSATTEKWREPRP